MIAGGVLGSKAIPSNIAATKQITNMIPRLKFENPEILGGICLRSHPEADDW